MRFIVRAVALAFVLGQLISCASVPERASGDFIRASDDPAIVERGRYLVQGPAHCPSCHGERMSGGRRFNLGPLGVVVAPNITSDSVAGIGALSDAMLVRSLRYGVSRAGRPLIPIMPFAELTDRDLQAIISYLRRLEPVSEAAPVNDFSWIGSLAVRVFLEPQGPTKPPLAEFAPERSAEYGRYLAHTVANCHGCHTRRSRLTGAFSGPAFAGGMKITEGQGAFVAPNLTPVPDGIVQVLSEQEFIERFRSRGQLKTPSPMPWAAFARMTEDDLAAIYRYLKTLPASPTSR
jgi:mono/diheme cytochrome c family protein